MSEKNGVLTHNLVHKETGDVVHKGNEKECKMALKAGFHSDIHKDYEIVAVDHFGSGDHNRGLRQKNINKNPELPKTHAEATKKAKPVKAKK